MKQLIKLSLLSLALLLPATASAYDFVVDGIYYNIINVNEVAVTYKGSESWQYIDEYTGDVTIPETVTYDDTAYSVTSIGYCAFADCTELISVTIPVSVTTISGFAFCESSLTCVTIPNSVTSIGEQAFCLCEELTSVNIPDSITSIEEYAFCGCI